MISVQETYLQLLMLSSAFTSQFTTPHQSQLKNPKKQVTAHLS